MSQVTIAGVTINNFADLNKLSTADLLAFYNETTGKNTKQFLKRAKGMQQVWALIEPQLAQVEAEAAPETAIPFVILPSPGEAQAAQPLKAQIGALLDFLQGVPRTVSEIAEGLKLANEKRARSLIDAARRAGHTITCVGRATFSLTAQAGEQPS